MTIYFSFNEPPSGIFSSQVIDVVKFTRLRLNQRIALVSFVSLRGFNQSRKKIMAQLPDALVLPMFPGVHRWRMNAFLLRCICWIKRPSLIIARSIPAANLAMKCVGIDVIYDGRGAIAAEWSEYNVVRDRRMLQEAERLEKEAVNKVQFRLAVSAELVSYWRTRYGYAGNSHIVIPCTIEYLYEQVVLDAQQISVSRDMLRYTSSDVVLVYSGSTAGWQTGTELIPLVSDFLSSSTQHRILFLSDKSEVVAELQAGFPAQVKRLKVEPSEVPMYLLAGDYGLLVRDRSVTNSVASPVKFAEYLACGLKVLISEYIGDFTDFVRKHDAGHVVGSSFALLNQNLEEKLRMRELALAHFSKPAFLPQYEKLFGLAGLDNFATQH
jgi:hypothetical protein